MRVLIITLHNILNNYGSVLQGFALCKFLNDKGYDAQVIDYCPKYKTNKLSVARNLLVKFIFLPYYIKRTRKFQNFIVNNNTLTQKQYKSYNQLQKAPPKADIYIAGSDQIWNSIFPCGKDPAYFLEFVKSGYKISYAASFGRDNIPVKELLMIKEKIKDFKRVSVREESGKNQLKKVGVKNVQHVADPVFLLSKKDYLKLINTKKGKISTKYQKYVLVYAVERNDLLSSVVSGIATNLRLKIISIGGFSKKCNSDKFDRTAGPEDFINLINNASFVVTSSFHCVAFSLIFKKNFAVVLPSKNPARLENIIATVGLEDRVIKRSSLINNILAPIDYSEPSKKLETYIQQSKSYLIDTLENIKQKK